MLDTEIGQESFRRNPSILKEYEAVLQMLAEFDWNHRGDIIDKEGIHFHEYPAWVVRDPLEEIGFVVGGMEYIECATVLRTLHAKRSQGD